MGNACLDRCGSRPACPLKMWQQDGEDKNGISVYPEGSISFLENRYACKSNFGTLG